MLEAVKRADLKATEWLANIQHPLLKDIMTGFSSLGSPVNSLVFLATISYFSISLLVQLSVSLFAAWVIVYGLKYLTSRKRPEGSLEAGMTSSFPSGHSATAFIFASVISQAYPSTAALLFSLAGIVAFSRVYLQTHYLSDAVSGSFIGLLLVALV